MTFPRSIPTRPKHSTPPPPSGPLFEVQRQLSTSPYAPLRSVRCEDKSGFVVLHGRVPSYYLKQLAQEVVRKTGGVRGVVNHLEVAQPPRRRNGSSAA
ncbi:MAG: BON domain-containing protein [Planctomycetota bacterium]|nr:MAG: BON domain-containing protein [Planctomycetota bacterium]